MHFIDLCLKIIELIMSDSLITFFDKKSNIPSINKISIDSNSFSDFGSQWRLAYIYGTMCTSTASRPTAPRLHTANFYISAIRNG